MRPRPAPEESQGTQVPPEPRLMAGSCPTPPPSSSSSSSPEGASGGSPLYHERQRLELCALHALNNLLQGAVFSRRAADDICERLAPGRLRNPHRSCLGTGNYDINLVRAALQGLGLAALWWDKRRPLARLELQQVLGFILNVPSQLSLGSLALPWRRRHWVALREHQGLYYNLDSKLKAPVAIGGEAELRTFLQDFLSQGLCELFVVVSEAVEEAGSWLSPE